jgi:hypothetical protein
MLFAFEERPIGDEHFTVSEPGHGGRARRLQPVGEDECAGVLHLLSQDTQVMDDRFEHLGRRRRAVGLVDAEQVLLHVGLLLWKRGRHPASISSSIRTASGQIDRRGESIFGIFPPAASPAHPGADLP